MQTQHLTKRVSKVWSPKSPLPSPGSSAWRWRKEGWREEGLVYGGRLALKGILKPVLEGFFQMGGDHISSAQFGGLVTVSRETRKVLPPSCYQGNFLSCIQGPRTRHI